MNKMIRIMKLTTVLLIATCLQVSAKSYSQKVTLKENDISLQKVFEEIREQTGYQFLYADEELVAAKKISINIKKGSIEQVLDSCFKNQELTYTISDHTIIVRKIIFPKSNTPPPLPITDEIKGKITDDKGQPLAGATILVKGTNTGTKSDADGNFIINAEPNSTLIISYVGFESREIKLGNRTYITMQLQPSAAIGEQIVVVGYGTQKRKDLTGAIAIISSKAFDDRPNTQFGNSIEGKAAGVQVIRPSGQPDAGFSVIIRGTSTITAGSDPLYIVDGVQTSNTSEINPADIESISILKDASSAAIYGSSGANGVVLITTKHGKDGKTKLSFNTSLTSSQAWKKLSVLNASQYDTLMNHIGIGINWANYTANTNWQNLVFRNALTQNYNLSASGGDENTQYYISGSLVNQQGIIINSSVNRATFNLNLDHKVNSFLKIGTNISYDKLNDVHILENSRNGVIARLLTTTPIIGVWSATNPAQYVPALLHL